MMKNATGMFLIVFLAFQGAYSSPKGKQSNIPFSRSLPEDISNENFPDTIENFDYPNATLLELAEAIGKLTGLNFIIDPGLAGKKIKIIAPSKITVAEAYKAFLSALAANGYTLVKKDAFWKITSTKSALKDNIEIYSGDYFPNTDQLITRIIKLKNINAKKFSDSTKYLLSQENAISHHEETNSIIISDYGSVIEKIMKLVEKMDLPGSKEQVKVIPIQHADAGDLSGILNQLIFKSKKSRTSFSRGVRGKRGSTLPPPLSNQGKNLEGNLKISIIIPDERTNSLIVSANERGFKKVKELVKKLDTYVDPARNGGIYVYNVLYGTAGQIYETLTGLGSKSGAAKPAKTGSSKGRSFRQPYGSSFSGGKSSQSPLFDNVTIMADNHTNSLIISARNRYDFERVKSVLKRIDVPKDQVFVQAVIVEMAVDKGDHWEVNFATALTSWLTNHSWFKAIFPPTKDGKASLVPIAGFLNQSFDIRSLAKGIKFGPGLILGAPLNSLMNQFNLDPDKANASSITREQLNTIADDKLRADVLKSTGRSNNQISSLTHLSMFPLLQILKKAGNFNILSTPQITALDNIKAFIEVGENAPVGLTSTTNTGSVAVQNSLERKDVTIRLEITPSINSDSGTVQMEIIQKFNDFSARQSTASELKDRGVHILKREIETTLVLNDGEIAVLGGLMVEKETKNENKIPILGDIPILGWLFKGSILEKQKNNLLVFIKPTIIEGKNQKADTRKLLGKKLEERIHFVKKYMRGKDPHGHFLKSLREKDPTENLSSASPPPEESKVDDVLIPPYPQETLERKEEILKFEEENSPEDNPEEKKETDREIEIFKEDETKEEDYEEEDEWEEEDYEEEEEELLLKKTPLKENTSSTIEEITPLKTQPSIVSEENKEEAARVLKETLSEESPNNNSPAFKESFPSAEKSPLEEEPSDEDISLEILHFPKDNSKNKALKKKGKPVSTDKSMKKKREHGI